MMISPLLSALAAAALLASAAGVRGIVLDPVVAIPTLCVPAHSCDCDGATAR